MPVHLRLYEIYNTVKLGWDRTSFLFYIATPAAIIGKFFGAAGLVAILITALFLYGAGKFHSRYESNKKKGKGKNSKKKAKKKQRIMISIW